MSVDQNQHTILWDSTSNNLLIDYELAGERYHHLISSWNNSNGIGMQCWEFDENEKAMRHVPLCKNPGLDPFIYVNDPSTSVFLDDIPLQIRTAAELFFPWSLPLLRLCNQFQGAADLLLNNPLLLWFSWKHIEKNKLTDFDINRLFKLKQKDILKLLLGHGSQSAIKILKRFEFIPFKEQEAKDLMLFFRNEQLIKSIRHISQPTINGVRLLLREPWIAGKPIMHLLFNTSDSKGKKDFNILLRDSKRLCLKLELDFVQELSEIKTLKQLKRIHDQLSDAYQNKIDKQDLSSIELPPPPSPGNALIRPLNTVGALINEGKVMRHCVSTYIDWVRVGYYYIYHLEFPEPVTIGVTVKEGKLDKIEQCRGVMNAMPSDQAMNIINEWFSAQ